MKNKLLIEVETVGSDHCEGCRYIKNNHCYLFKLDIVQFDAGNNAIKLNKCRDAEWHLIQDRIIVSNSVVKSMHNHLYTSHMEQQDTEKAIASINKVADNLENHLIIKLLHELDYLCTFEHDVNSSGHTFSVYFGGKYVSHGKKLLDVLLEAKKNKWRPLKDVDNE